MKVKCNISNKCGIVDLGKPQKDKTINCPTCDKELAYGVKSHITKKIYWAVMDSEYDEDFGFIPVEIITE